MNFLAFPDPGAFGDPFSGNSDLQLQGTQQQNDNRPQDIMYNSCRTFWTRRVHLGNEIQPESMEVHIQIDFAIHEFHVHGKQHRTGLQDAFLQEDINNHVQIQGQF